MDAQLSQWITFTVPTLASDAHIALYKHIRLSGLSIDPEAFGSTFDKESTFTDDTWRLRINTKGRTTLLATRADSEGDHAIGTLSILSPEMLAGIPQEPPYPPSIEKEEREGLAEIYVLVGMWVHPDHRGKGVGRTLVDRALEAIRVARPRLSLLNVGTPERRHSERARKIALLLVHNDQHAAIHLYHAAGLVEHGEVEHTGKMSTWMAAPVV